MERLSMCRVCLEEDIRLHSIVETHLQEMYDSLVLIPFETKDRRPILACYICCARLQNCYELRRRCIRSEELFTQMLSCDELEPVQLQEINSKKGLTVHHVVHFSVGHVPQMSTDNLGVEVLTFDGVKVEKDDPDDIDEDAQEEYSVYDNIQYADSDDDPLIIVKEEESIDRTSDPTPKESKQAAQRNPGDLTSSNLKEHELVQDMFKVPAAGKTAAKNTNRALQQRYSSKCKLERHIRLCSDVWKKDLSRESSTSSHTHTGQRPHQCHVCEKCFLRASDLIKHMFTHTGEKPHHCDICKKQFSQKPHLICHMHTHTGEKPYHCDICKKQFSQKPHLINHMHTHTGQKPHQCHVCKKGFSRKSHLTRHSRTHTGEKPFQCHVCKKSFSMMGNLSTHMLTHTGEKPYHCSMCEKSFSIKRNLNRHMLTHTGEKPYYCDICKKQFSLKNTLTKHMRIHTGEKPYHCHLCNKQFTLKTTLSNHIRTHTGEKPYQCNRCQKQFTQVSNLNYHTCTHTGEKLHQCDLCKKCFSDRSSLKKHFLTHERIYLMQQI